MDDIFDLNEVDTESLDSPVEETELIEAIPTSSPYWQVPTDSLSSFLQLASQFSWRSGRDLTSKSVSLTVSEDKTQLICRATDFDTFLEYTLPQSSQTPITTPLVFPTATLLKLTKLSPKFLVLELNGETPRVLILGQWIPVESIVLAPSLYINSDPIQQIGETELPKSLSDIIPIASSAVVPKDRQIQFYPNCVQSTLLWSVLQVTPFNTPIPFTLSSREASMVKTIASSSPVKLGVTESDLPRLVIQSQSARLWLIHRKPEAEVSNLDSIPWSLTIDGSSLAKLVTVSETLPSSSGLLQFDFTDSLSVTYCSKLGNTPFSISASVTGEPTELNQGVVQTKILKQLLKPLGNAPITLNWSSETLYLCTPSAHLSIQFEK